MVTNQAYLFLVFIVNGVLIGLLFDFFRILRKTFKTKDFVTYIQDILFWILTGFIILYSTFTFNNGEIRIFMFLGILIGVVAYMTTISPYVIKVNVKIINFIKDVIQKIFNVIIIPFKWIFNFFNFILKKYVNIMKKFVPKNISENKNEKTNFNVNSNKKIQNIFNNCIRKLKKTKNVVKN